MQHHWLNSNQVLLVSCSSNCAGDKPRPSGTISQQTACSQTAAVPQTVLPILPSHTCTFSCTTVGAQFACCSSMFSSHQGSVCQQHPAP
jgi:hypothetical protein